MQVNLIISQGHCTCGSASRHRCIRGLQLAGCRIPRHHARLLSPPRSICFCANAVTVGRGSSRKTWNVRFLAALTRSS